MHLKIVFVVTEQCFFQIFIIADTIPVSDAGIGERQAFDSMVILERSDAPDLIAYQHNGFKILQFRKRRNVTDEIVDKFHLFKLFAGAEIGYYLDHTVCKADAFKLCKCTEC